MVKHSYEHMPKSARFAPSGFSLLEVLVALSIGAIGAVVLVVAFGQERVDESKIDLTLPLIEQVHEATLGYYNDTCSAQTLSDPNLLNYVSPTLNALVQQGYLATNITHEWVSNVQIEVRFPPFDALNPNPMTRLSQVSFAYSIEAPTSQVAAQLFEISTNTSRNGNRVTYEFANPELNKNQYAESFHMRRSYARPDSLDVRGKC